MALFAPLFSLAVATTLKGTVLLIGALVLTLCVRRAAARHQLLHLALLGLLVLPGIGLLVPSYSLDILPAGTREVVPGLTAALLPEQAGAKVHGSLSLKTAASATAEGRTGTGAKPGRPMFIIALFLFGVAACFGRMAAGYVGLRQLVRESEPLCEPQWESLLAQSRQVLGVSRTVRLYRTERSLLPLTSGFLHPFILLPSEALDWPQERRRLVLLHELAHIKRRDCLVHTLAQAVCALHWFNPLSWLTEQLMRKEREMAADDLVLLSGVRPSSYASELLEVARRLLPANPSPVFAVALLGGSRLQRRLRRVLDPHVDHRMPGWRFNLGMGGVLLGLLLSLGALKGSAAVPATALAAVPEASPAAAAKAEGQIEKLRMEVQAQLGEVLGQRPAEVELTLDAVAQSLVEQELDDLAQRFRPAGASILVLDPQNSAVLGMGSRGGAKNLAVEEIYEPASTLKVFTVAAALEAGTIRPQQIFFAEHGSMATSGGTVQDATPSADLTVADILARSSNIGAIKIYRTLGKERLAQSLSRFHFGERPLVELPAAAGSAMPTDLTEAQAELVSCGHGLKVSPLQLAAAFAAVVNKGTYNPPLLARSARGKNGALLWQHTARPEQVLQAATAQAVMEMLEGVVQRDDGTGVQARVPGYRVAGKTGTGTHTGLFVGAVPATAPRIVILVTVDAPAGTALASGGSVAAPSFRHIAEQLLPYLHVQPTSSR